MNRKTFCRIFLSTILVSVLFVSCTKKSTESVAGKVSGVITISPELAAKLKPETDVLYIIARNQQVGPPTAVKRIIKPQFPLQYVIGPEDAMMPGTQGFVAGENVTIAARISRTGNAMPSTGDLEGAFKNNPAHPGDGGVDVLIEKERP